MLPGSEIQPTDAATWSPKLLLMASPGMSSSLSHTLAGPINSPFSSLNGSTRPLRFMILILSSLSDGLWSLLRSWFTQSNLKIHLLPFISLPNTALESPTFAQISFSGVYMTVTQVEPLKLVSIIVSLHNLKLIWLNDSVIILFIFVFFFFISLSR